MSGVEAMNALAKLQQVIAKAVDDALKAGVTADDVKQVVERCAELLEQYGE